MTATRADIEQELVSRAGRWLTAAGLDGVTVNGTNASLNGAIGWAIRTAGGSVANPALVTSTDVATVTNLDLLLDLAEYRALQSVVGNYTAVDKKAGPVELKSSQLAAAMADRLASLRSWLLLTYGIGGGAFSVTLTRTDGYSEWAAES